MILVATASAATLNGTGVIKGGLLNVQLAKYDPVPAEAGNIMTVWIKVENRGIEPVPNATFVLVPSYPFSLPNNDPERNYGRITGLDDIRLEYKVLVDKKAINGTYSLKMKYHTGDKIWLEKEFSLTVKELEREKKADLKALFVNVDPAAYSNGNTRLTVDIANVGDGTAFYTIVKAVSDVASIERNEIFVGTLGPNDFDSADFELKLSDAVGNYPVSIITVYKDSDGNEITQSSTVYMEILSQEEAKRAQKNETPVWAYAIYLILIILAVKFVFMPIWKKARKKK